MIVKLLAFTFAMIVVPIGSYFATVNTVFKGERARVPRLRVVIHKTTRPTTLRSSIC